MMPAVSGPGDYHNPNIMPATNPLFGPAAQLGTNKPLVQNGTGLTGDLINLAPQQQTSIPAYTGGGPPLISGATNQPLVADNAVYSSSSQPPMFFPQQPGYQSTREPTAPSSTPLLMMTSTTTPSYQSPLMQHPSSGNPPMGFARPPLQGSNVPVMSLPEPARPPAPSLSQSMESIQPPTTALGNLSLSDQQHPMKAMPPPNVQSGFAQNIYNPPNETNGQPPPPPMSHAYQKPPLTAPPLIPVSNAPGDSFGSQHFSPSSSQRLSHGAHMPPPLGQGPPPQNFDISPRGYPPVGPTPPLDAKSQFQGQPPQWTGQQWGGPPAQLDGPPSGPVPPATSPSGSTTTPRASYPQTGGYQQQAQKKLDPDHMPSPIQVMYDDSQTRGGNFSTLERGAVPPLVTTNFVAQDQGNCNPRLMRSVLYSLPCNSDMYNQSHVTMGVAITPFARLHKNEMQPPVVDMGTLGPVRCSRCKAYMCPNMGFIEGGRRYQCCFCICVNDVPEEYFNHLDHTGRRMDTYERPELSLGAYEFVATKDYCKNDELPLSPAYIFMIDVSYNSVKSGLLDLICSKLKDEVLRNLAVENGHEESEIRVGFVTYDKELHFYNVKGSLSQPQMLVVADIEDVFLPLLDGFLVKLSESEMVIDSLLEQISTMFANSRETETVLGPVIQAGLSALKSSKRPGKLFVFHTSLPIAQAPGRLKNRDDRKLISTDKEKNLLCAQTKFYEKLGEECVQAGCAVDLFLFPNSYIDVSTIASICQVTGGNLYKYNYFQADLDGEQLLTDLRENVSQQIAYDAIVRVRTSTGIRASDFYGNFFMENTTDMEFGAIDSSKSVCVEIKHDDKLNENEGAYVQAAVLFTNSVGQRRIRILNLALNCTANMADMYRSCELDTLVAFFAKKALQSCLSYSTKAVREQITSDCAQILACYRRNCATNSSAGQLILPECMKLLPLYLNCIIRNTVVSTADATLDERCYLMCLVNSMDIQDMGAYFYPRLYNIHDLTEDYLPHPIRCSKEEFETDSGIVHQTSLRSLLRFD